MPSVNKVIIVGNLGADPELRQTAEGRAICRFSVATNRRFTDKAGAQQERVCWHRIVAWGKQGELCGTYLKKGRTVYVEGRLERSSYKDSQGVERVSTEIVSHSVLFLSPVAREALPADLPPPHQPAAFDDELPF